MDTMVLRSGGEVGMTSEKVYRINVYKARTNTFNYEQLRTYTVTGESMRDINAMLSDLYRGKGKQFDIYRVVNSGKDVKK